VATDVVTDALQGGPVYSWKVLFAALVLLALIVAGFVWHRRSGQVSGETAGRPVIPARQQIKDAAAALETACQHNDAQAAARALLQWADASWSNESLHNLGALAQRLVSGKEEIRGLERALYAADAANWQGDALWQVFSKGLEVVTRESPVRAEGLSPLYPDWKAR